MRGWLVLLASTSQFLHLRPWIQTSMPASMKAEIFSPFSPLHRGTPEELPRCSPTVIAVDGVFEAPRRRNATLPSFSSPPSWDSSICLPWGVVTAASPVSALEFPLRSLHFAVSCGTPRCFPSVIAVGKVFKASPAPRVTSSYTSLDRRWYSGPALSLRSLSNGHFHWRLQRGSSSAASPAATSADYSLPSFLSLSFAFKSCLKGTF